MDQFPSLIDFDMDTPYRHSIGVGTLDLHPSQYPRRPFCKGDSSNPSLFHHQPYTPHETTTSYETINPVQGSHDCTGRPEISNPPPPVHQGEGSTSAPTRGHNVNQGKMPTGSGHHSPLHIGTIPVATNVPLNQQSPIRTPLVPTGPNPTQPVVGHMPTQGYRPMGKPGLNQEYIPQQMSGGIQYPTGPTYQNFPSQVGHVSQPSGYNQVNLAWGHNY